MVLSYHSQQNSVISVVSYSGSARRPSRTNTSSFLMSPDDSGYSTLQYTNSIGNVLLISPLLVHTYHQTSQIIGNSRCHIYFLQLKLVLHKIFTKQGFLLSFDQAVVANIVKLKCSKQYSTIILLFFRVI